MKSRIIIAQINGSGTARMSTPETVIGNMPLIAAKKTAPVDAQGSNPLAFLSAFSKKPLATLQPNWGSNGKAGGENKRSAA